MGGAIKNAELCGNQKALQTKFWSDTVIQVNPFVLCLAMVKGTPVPESRMEQAEQFMAAKLEEALNHEWQQAHMTYNLMKLQKLGQQGLDLRLIEVCHNLLRHLKLPVTSAHGDLHIENMILIDEEIRIIDWCMYNRSGSFITDYIHFYNFAEAVKHNESWTVAIQKDSDYLRRLASHMSTEPGLLSIVYTLNRIAGEASQFPRTDLVPASQIDKYNAVLTHLTTSIKQNV
ncbi:phosphotransferase [Pontibacter lucknowensis]|nr:phosphotransferase [Pontibacter lucknowensis]